MHLTLDTESYNRFTVYEVESMSLSMYRVGGSIGVC